MPSTEHSFRVVGHPILDSYSVKDETEKKYIIYAPHWTVCGDNLRFGTFKWSGEKMLNFAKSHPELNWVFRPHPLLYNFIISSGFMRQQEIDKYYDEWKSFAVFSEGGDYIDLFKQSYAMITDCGSFLTEYFVTENPVIHLVSEQLNPNSTIQEIDKTYYTAHDSDELIKHLHHVILDKNDYKKEERVKLLEKLNFRNSNSAEKIINDILYDITS
jgi:UDP-N-acetylglucosamine 2-epimerase